MNAVKTAAVQMKCSAIPEENLAKAEEKIREAAEHDAKMIFLPELFGRNYFCQERNYDFYEYAKSVEEAAEVRMGQRLSEELNIVLPVSFFERDGNVLYNSLAVFDGGKYLGLYRKTHIPDDHYYQEKFYFTPGNTGFRVFATQYGKLGCGICWDQWFPETARCLALQGADLIYYPTAIGSEPILGCDSMPHWCRCMQGHAAANLVPVTAVNRVGTETVLPGKENGGQSSSLCFYGSSFFTDETGEILQQADRTSETILYCSYDFDAIRKNRLSWGLFRDRRPECYKDIAE